MSYFARVLSVLARKPWNMITRRYIRYSRTYQNRCPLCICEAVMMRSNLDTAIFYPNMPSVVYKYIMLDKTFFSDMTKYYFTFTFIFKIWKNLNLQFFSKSILLNKFKNKKKFWRVAFIKSAIWTCFRISPVHIVLIVIFIFLGENYLIELCSIRWKCHLKLMGASERRNTEKAILDNTSQRVYTAWRRCSNAINRAQSLNGGLVDFEQTVHLKLEVSRFAVHRDYCVVRNLRKITHCPRVHSHNARTRWVSLEFAKCLKPNYTCIW